MPRNKNKLLEYMVSRIRRQLAAGKLPYIASPNELIPWVAKGVQTVRVFNGGLAMLGSVSNFEPELALPLRLFTFGQVCSIQPEFQAGAA